MKQFSFAIMVFFFFLGVLFFLERETKNWCERVSGVVNHTKRLFVREKQREEGAKARCALDFIYTYISN